MEYRNARYISERGDIDCEINHTHYGWIPYTINLDDEDMTIDNSVLLTSMATNNDVLPYVPPTQEELYERESLDVRGTRDSILREQVDPIVSNPLRWADMSEAKQQEWAAYRRALLDITSQDGFPFSIEWPIKPE